jgi:soluble lytic murein transglycosylase
MLGFRTLAILALGIALATPATAAAPESGRSGPALSPELRERFAVAIGTLRSGDPAIAAREFADPAWAATPLRDYARLLHAESLLRAGDAAAARAAAGRVADAGSDGRPVPSALLQWAAILSRAGDDAGAAGLYGRFLDRYPDHPDAARARHARAQSLLAAGRVAEAARAFTDVWLLTPASPQAEDAARQLRVLEERGVGRAAPPPRERVERAERLLSAGVGDTAAAEAEALLGTGLPADLAARALRVVAEAARRSGRLDAAIATANRALADLPPERRPAWLLELARLQQRRSREAAIAAVDRLAREHPRAPELAEGLLMKARLLESGARLADAESVYQRLAADHADQAEGGAALWQLGWLAWFRGAHGEAAARWTRLLSARGGQPHREAATYWIGRAHQQRGDGDLAARQFAQLEADAPRSYYGILASRRGPSTVAARPPAAPVTLPADPREPLQTDPQFARVEALRAVGLAEFADEEMGELTRRSLGEPTRLYALSAAYAEEARPHLALRILRRHFYPLARSGVPGLPRAFWEMFYPLGWRLELTEAAIRAAIDPMLVAAVVREESSFHPQARSRVGARGLMQLMPETARPMAQSRRLAFNDGDILDDPGANLEMGSAFLAGLLRQFGDPRLAVAAYNAGPARVREWWASRRSEDLEVWVEQIPYNETRGFVKRVMLSWDEYRRLYGGATATEAHERISALP